MLKLCKFLGFKLVKTNSQYKDVPVDLADATLIVVSERRNINNIIIIESDFHIYRNKNNGYIKNIFKKKWE